MIFFFSTNADHQSISLYRFCDSEAKENDHGIYRQPPIFPVLPPSGNVLSEEHLLLSYDLSANICFQIKILRTSVTIRKSNTAWIRGKYTLAHDIQVVSKCSIFDRMVPAVWFRVVSCFI